MTSQVLRKLERDGWLERSVDPQDSRARRLHVTPAGAELARRAIAVVEDDDAQTFGDDGPALVALLADERVPSRTASA
jgi:DNA-binding MarR family transcriptional regulator